MQKINFEDATLVTQAKVTVGGTDYEVTPATYSGGTDLDANTLNDLQDNFEASFKNTSSNSTTDGYCCTYINDALVDAYSTSEVKTNKIWANGKPIYRKVFAGSFSVVNNWTTISNSIITDKQTTTNLSGVFSDYLPIPVYVNSDYSIALQYNASEGIQIYSKGYTGYYSVIIEYTKTTD